jgi:hypothetical protein
MAKKEYARRLTDAEYAEFLAEERKRDERSRKYLIEMAEQPNGNAGDAVNFGRVSSSRPPRLVQLAAKFSW